MVHLMKCSDCSNYTLQPVCPQCSTATQLARPAKFTVHDSYADYRRKAKEAELKRKGWL